MPTERPPLVPEDHDILAAFCRYLDKHQPADLKHHIKIYGSRRLFIRVHGGDEVELLGTIEQMAEQIVIKPKAPSALDIICADVGCT